jgi:hypothetical protein
MGYALRMLKQEDIAHGSRSNGLFLVARHTKHHLFLYIDSLARFLVIFEPEVFFMLL